MQNFLQYIKKVDIPYIQPQTFVPKPVVSKEKDTVLGPGGH
jgi:hypothetical protein